MPPVIASVCADLTGRRRDEENPDSRFYAASTMKVPVLIAVFRAVEHRRLSLETRLPVTTTFASIVDGSPFGMDPDDADPEFAALEGTSMSVGELAERMIVDSSNEATDILLQHVELAEAQRAVDDLGAVNTVIARPIGDLKAADAGIQNLVTAADLVRLLSGIVNGEAAGRDSCERMTAILCRQRHRVGIPAALPQTVRSASKGGWVTRLRHDVAVVWPPDAPPYCQAVCSSGLQDDAALAQIHRRARAAWAARSEGAA